MLGSAERLTVFLEQTDHFRRDPLFTEIVRLARSAGLAGATVFRGVEGFGATRRLHAADARHLSDDVPVIIVIVDQSEQIDAFLPRLDGLVGDALVVRQPVEVVTGAGGEQKAMRLQGSAKRLTIYCGEGDGYHLHSTARAIVERARDEGMAGATVVRGIEGYGASTHLHTDRIVSLSDDLPIVIEIVDQGDRIAAFLPVVEQLLDGGMVTVEDLEVARSAGGEGPGPEAK